MKVYLIRHAESVGNIRGNLTSTTDFELTDKGKKQAQKLGIKLNNELKEKNITAYCSPLLRAKQTLQEILNCIKSNDINIIESPALKEMDLGVLEGMPFDEQLNYYPDIDLGRKLSYLKAPEGECYNDIKQRVKQFCNLYIGNSNTKHIIIVSHGITLRVLINNLLQRPDEDVNFLNWLENTSLTVLKYDNKSRKFYIERLNDYSHLQELETVNYKNWGIFAKEDAYLNGLL